MKAISFIIALFMSISMIAQSTEIKEQESKRVYDPEAKKILDKVSKKYNAYKAIKVKVLLNTYNKDAEINDNQDLEITLSGNKYRIKVDSSLVMICDGESAWNVDLEEMTGTQEEYEESDDQSEITPSNIWTIYEKGFQYVLIEEKTVNGVKQQVIDLIPEDNELDYFKIKMTLKKDNQEIVNMKVLGKDGTHYTYELSDFNSSPELGDNAFKFDASEFPNVEMEDIR